MYSAYKLNKQGDNTVLGCNLKNDRMISVRFEGKPFNITVIQVYAEEAEVERFCEDLQDLLELTPKKVLFIMLSRLVITFLPRSKRLLISWLQSPSVVILEPRKIKSATVSIVSPYFCYLP